MNTDPAALAELKKRNAANKRMIQAKRSKFAITKAKIEHIDHGGKFPSKYKYG